MIIEKLIFIFALMVACYAVFMYTSGFIINLYFKRFDVKRDYTYQPKVSVILSCFNESEVVYRTIKSMRESNYPVEKLEILAFDDCSKDDSFEWIQKAAHDFPNVIARLNAKNQGKAHTVLDAVDISTGDIIVGVDSDCIFDPNAIRELMACFTEEKIAAVGGRVGVSNADETWLTRCQAVFYAMSFLIIKSSENVFRKIQCLSGPLVAIRRECFDQVRDQIEKRSFLGVKVTNGEDRALTQMLLRQGYDTYVNCDSMCWTTVPTHFSQYAKQQLRWRRSAVGQWLDALVKLPIMLRNNSVLSAIFSLMPITVMLSWNLLIITSWMSGNLMEVMGKMIFLHMFLAPIIAIGFNYFTSRHLTTDAIKGTAKLTLSLMLSSLWFPFSGLFITLFASSTLDDGGWVTRANGAQT